MIRRLRYLLWWTWPKMRLGSEVMIAAGYEPSDLTTLMWYKSD